MLLSIWPPVSTPEPGSLLQVPLWAGEKQLFSTKSSANVFFLIHASFSDGKELKIALVFFFLLHPDLSPCLLWALLSCSQDSRARAHGPMKSCCSCLGCRVHTALFFAARIVVNPCHARCVCCICYNLLSSSGYQAKTCFTREALSNKGLFTQILSFYDSIIDVFYELWQNIWLSLGSLFWWLKTRCKVYNVQHWCIFYFFAIISSSSQGSSLCGFFVNKK